MSQFTDQASTIASNTDAIFLALLGLSSLIMLVVFGLILFFLIKYRRGSKADRTNPPRQNLKFEAGLIVTLFALAMVTFVFGAGSYFNIVNPPDNALNIYVVGKQWMWKYEHAEGRSEISDLHVPVNRPVKLTMISQDVIHNFSVPAFRIKKDVLPGQYTTLWFEATHTGQYHLFCNQYCGTNHALMSGTIIVLTSEQYAQWLAGNNNVQPTVAAANDAAGDSANIATNASMVESGASLFQNYGCSSCHLTNNQGVGPSLIGLYGRSVQMDDGSSTIADDAYIRESIFTPDRRIVAGYKPLMPTFQDQLSEEEILALIAYIKSGGQEAKR